MQPGEVQIMSTSTGISHSEDDASDTEQVDFLHSVTRSARSWKTAATMERSRGIGGIRRVVASARIDENLQQLRGRFES